MFLVKPRASPFLAAGTRYRGQEFELVGILARYRCHNLEGLEGHRFKAHFRRRS
jgi:hypothetical protein